MLLLLDPSGNATGIVQRYSAAATERGWIVASSAHVRNGTADEDDTRELLSLLSYVRAQTDVDERKVWSAGFSGGGCGAYRIALVRPDVVRGAIVECGHMGPWREVGSRASAAQAFYLFTRDGDSNRQATQQLQTAMSQAGCRTTLVQRPGGHEPMSSPEIVGAFDWLANG